MDRCRGIYPERLFKMKSKKEMKKVILHFALKYRGNWEKIYEAIKAREDVTIEEIENLREKYNDNFISIIDDDYPDNFKNIYMPPLTIFFVGNKSLLSNSDSIISLWGDTSYEQFVKSNLKTNKVYAINYSSDQQDNIVKILEAGYKLILISNEYNTNDLGFIANYDNLLFLTEIPFDTKKADIDVEQTIERMLLGVSKQSIMLGDKRIHTFEYLEPLFKFEKRHMIVTDLEGFSQSEIDRFNIKLYQQNAN